MNKHSFFKYCIDPGAFENVNTLRKFLEVLKKQSNLEEAKIPYREDLNKAEDEEFKSIKSPRYFGAGVESLAEVFFVVFGMSFYNIGNYRSQDTIELDLEDIGYDATAVTAKEKKYGKIIEKIAYSGSPVYIQVKGSLNPTKEHMTNDSSRIPNFVMSSAMDATAKGHAYSARYILFTTAKGIHYKLDTNSKGQIEVIGFKDISRKVDNNIIFWNEFRAEIGLSQLDVNGPLDVEYQTMQKNLDTAVET